MGRRPRWAPPWSRTQGTLNAYGFGEGTVLVGGYRHSDGKPAAYSASGADAHASQKQGHLADSL